MKKHSTFQLYVPDSFIQPWLTFLKILPDDPYFLKVVERLKSENKYRGTDKLSSIALRELVLAFLRKKGYIITNGRAELPQVESEKEPQSETEPEQTEDTNEMDEDDGTLPDGVTAEELEEDEKAEAEEIAKEISNE